MRRQILDNIIDEKSLLKHPFYQAWNEGKLTTDDLALYATQYGEFIDRIASGWEMAGDATTAAEEREHAVLWTKFATALGAKRPAARRLPEIEELVSLADAAFETRPRALGALYAFEQQQPSTAASKLDGLRKYYCHIPPSAQVYFEVHKDDEEEPQWLADQIEKLSDEEFVHARMACESMTAALWRGLDGVTPS